MPARHAARPGTTRRDFLAGALATGTLASVATYFAPGGSTPPEVTIKFVTSADPTGSRNLLVSLWNQANPRATVEVEEVSGSTRDQRNAMLARATDPKAEPPDVLNLDVIDIADFVCRKLLAPVELENVPEFLPVTLLPSQLGDPASTTYWAAPYATDVGLVFQRLPAPALGSTAPPLATVIDKLVADGTRGFVGQLKPSGPAASEAIVVNMLEHALSRDPDILDPKTGMPSVALERWQKALAPLRAAIKAGRVDQAETEDQTRDRFRTAPRPFMRNWPTEYRRLQQDQDPAALSSMVAVGALPNGVLGGGSLAITAAARQPERAADFVRFMTGVPAQTILASYGVASTRSAPYEDANLRAIIPHLSQIRTAVEDARPRPISCFYRDFTDRMYNQFTRWLQGTELSSTFVDDITRTLRLK